MKVHSTHRRFMIRTSLVPLTLGMAVPALAAAGHLPPEHMQGAVAFVSGGVGEDEAAAMKQAAQGYPLELNFFKRMPCGYDVYLATDEVAMKDQHGKVMMHTTADGPFLLARLPTGRYSVSASNDGVTKEHRVSIVPGKHERVVFEW